jgi:ethanolamine transporter EutH
MSTGMEITLIVIVVIGLIFGGVMGHKNAKKLFPKHHEKKKKDDEK